MKRISSACFVLLAALAGVALAPSRPPQVGRIEAFHRSGQTFLTFDEIQSAAAGRIRYRIYRSPHPIRTLEGLGPLASISQDSAFNPRASNPRVEGRRVQLRIREGEDVPPGRALFVYTTPREGEFYYCATSVLDGRENRTLSTSNCLARPLAESVALPEPVLQGITRAADGLPAARYVQFVNANPTPLLPPMANSFDTRAIHFNFLLRGARAEAQNAQPLVIGFHGGNQIFSQALQPTGDPEEILLGLDDPHPPAGYPPAVNTLWFGFAPNLGRGTPREAGRIEPYTLRRIRATVDWVRRRFRVDPNRVYCAGTSFGAIGSLMYGLHYSREIAAMWLNLPRYDFRADGPDAIPDPEHPEAPPSPAWDIERGGASPVSERFNVLFGSRGLDLPTPREKEALFQTPEDGLGIYERVNFRAIVERFPEIDLPVLLLYHGKFDNVTGWHEKPLMVRALERARQPFQFYFITSGHRFQPSDPFLDRAHRRSRLNDYRLNQATVSFSEASNNDRLGDGLDMVRCARSSRGATLDLGQTSSTVRHCIQQPDGLIRGARQGTVNGYLEWNRQDMVDLSYRFEVSLFVLEASRAGEATADVTLRRLERLRHRPGQRYRFRNLDLASGAPLEPERMVEADSLGRIVIERVKIHKRGSRLILETRPATAR